MTNPARELRDLLVEWQPSEANQSILEARGGGKRGGDAAFWARQGEAVLLLAEIEERLAAMEADGRDIEGCRERLPAWYRAVFGPKYDWFDKPKSVPGAQPWQYGGRGLPEEDRRVLSTLATLIDMQTEAQARPQADLAALFELLNEAEELARDVEGLPDDDREYLLALIGEARSVVGENRFTGGARPRRLVVELGGAMMLTIGSATPEQQKKAVGLAERFFGWAGAKFGGKGLEEGAVMAVQAISDRLGS